MPKNIIIVGAGGFGREVCGYAEDCIAAGAPWRIKGFIDDNATVLDDYDYPWPIVGCIADYAPQPDDAFLLAIGAPALKKKISERLLGRGAKFETLVHPTARIGRNVVVGQGCIFCPQVNITCDCVIGDFVILNAKSGCGHDARVGHWATFSAFCDVTGFCQVGEGVFLASGVSTVPSIKIGDWASVGINSSVVVNIKPGLSVYGNPAVPIGKAR